MASFPTDATYDSGSTITYLSNRKPDKGLSINNGFKVQEFISQAQYNKRTLLTRKSFRTFNLTYTNINGYYKAAIENFYNARFGNFESFSFDTSYINLSGTITVKFGDDGLNITKVQDSTTSLYDTIYTITFSLNEVYQ